VKRELANLALQEGLEHCELLGDVHRGLPLLAYALELAALAEAPDLERVIRVNLAEWGRHLTPPRAILIHDGGWPSVNAPTFSPDGKLLATASDDGAVRLWDTATGRAVGKPLGNPVPRPRQKGPVTNARDVTEQELLFMAPEQDPVYSLAFSPDGKLLAAGSL